MRRDPVPHRKEEENGAAVDPKTKQPVENGARNVWVTETALSIALNTAFFAESVATVAIVMGAAPLIIGILILTLRLLRQPYDAPARARHAAAVAS